MSEKIFTVDKFLGLNESAGGATELKMGEASKIENFSITDSYNLKSRPGIVPYLYESPSSPYKAPSVRYLSVFMYGDSYLIEIIRDSVGNAESTTIYKGIDRVLKIPRNVMGVITYNGSVYFLWISSNIPDIPAAGEFYRYEMSVSHIVRNDDGSFTEHTENTYSPLVLSGCTPSGKGTEIERLNILSDFFRVEFIADGTSTAYVLPSAADQVTTVASTQGTFVGTFDPNTHIYTFTEAPEKGVEISFHCRTNDEDLLAARKRFLKMPYHEYYNGDTDSRMFFYGDGTNLCYYTGIPADGSNKLYVPALNELCVDFSDSPITGLVRHYSRLLAFKPDGVDAITYEPITLADGSVTAGLYLRPVSRAFGNDALGQAHLVKNNPRTFTGGGLYEWQVASYSYRDERNAKLVSQKVANSIAAADPQKLIAFDDDANKTYYVFLNDENGTVLVNRYELDVWSVFRSELTKNVAQVLSHDGKMLFLHDNILYYFDENSTFDVPLGESNNIPIDYVWESGYMSFGADYKRKYSSNIWVSMLPEAASQMEITVKTDRRAEYLAKIHGLPLLDFGNIDFSNFSFLTRNAPKIKRIKIKVKKFVYYKLIFRSKKPGTRATILGYDQQVRYSSNVK